MARQRIINPELWLDEEICQFDSWRRLLYIGSWNFSDDYGVIENSPQKLKAQVFPYDEIDVKPMIDDFIKVGKYIPFELEGKKYLYIKNFLKYQKVDKPSKFRYPMPPPEILGDYSESTSFPLNSEEKRREVKRKEKKRREYDDIKFIQFWSIYPNKVGKPDAYDAWLELKEEQKDKILEDIPLRKEDEKWIKGYIKHPVRYISTEQWEDEIKKVANLSVEIK